VIVDALEYEKPKTKDFAALLKKVDATGKKVLVLTASDSHNVYLSGRNIPDVRVMRFADASAYEIMWSQTVLVEIGALEQGPAKTQEANDA
jgi:large subunit ribosomal protein L4